MSTKHSKSARRFLVNGERSDWHDSTLWGVRVKRDRMSKSLPEWETLRETASAIKMHTLSHLDTYMERFADNAQKNGVVVHWAKDADEFNSIILDILRSHQVHKLVKSKSMLTEECEMNPYLEKHGIEVVETDLGERIIQLLGQKPSHIVMPAIHLTQEEVGALSELRSQGQQFYSISWEYPNSIYQGETGDKVRHLQYMLSVLSAYIPSIPPVQVDGVYGPATADAVVAAQRWFGLPETGSSVDSATWDAIYDQFSGIENTSLRSGENFPSATSNTVPAFSANRSNQRSRYNNTSTMTQFPGRDLSIGNQDPIKQEVIR